MHVVQTIAEVRSAVREARRRGLRIGCVPTMGALHAGHMSLVAECRRQSGFVAVWIFVNPTQFAPHEDLEKYPRPLEDDLTNCRAAGVDLVFTPDGSSLYPERFETYVTVERLSQILEGEHRPTHFRGVATIVTKLFNIIQPDVACFGQKDYQQQALIRRMVHDLDIPVEIVTCPTVREPDGLALSSRNVYLSADERRAALSLYEALQLAAERIGTGETDLAKVRAAMLDHLRSQPLVEPDYSTIADTETLEQLDTPRPRMVALVAATVGRTRLIDNLIMHTV
ncbi:MAG: pantoate--beta-alanine ligase [Planctomycetaceae bacterium]